MEDPFTLHERLRARLALVRVDLEEILDRLSDEDLPFAPREGMRTIGGQLYEIGGTEIQIMAWVRDHREVSFKIANDFGAQGESVSGMRQALEEVRTQTLTYLDSLSDADLETPIAMPKGWFESLGRQAVPPSEVFRSLAQHEWYHVGQLVSYLWFRGDDPYEW